MMIIDVCMGILNLTINNLLFELAGRHQHQSINQTYYLLRTLSSANPLPFAVCAFNEIILWIIYFQINENELN